MDETTNQVIKENEIQAKDWSFSSLSEHLYIWFDLFNERFFQNTLKTPVISFEKRRVNNLGHFVIDRNALGLKWNINVNSLYVDLPLVDTLATLLHETAHQWQQEFGKKKGKNSYSNYHNVEFRTKTRLLGIPSNKSGVTLSYQDPFLSLLKFHGVCVKSSILSDGEIKMKEKQGRSKLKKWSCGCTNVRVGIKDFEAQCLKCGNKFKMA